MNNTVRLFTSGWIIKLTRRLMRKQRVIITSEKQLRRYTLENFELGFEEQ